MEIKVKPIHCRVSIHFDGSYQFNGNESIEVSGRFGESYQPSLHGVKISLLMPIR